MRGRSFPRSPPPAEIQPAEPSASAPVEYPRPGVGGAADLHQSPSAEELSAHEAEAAGLELQPMLPGTAGDSSAVTNIDATAPLVQPAQQPPAYEVRSLGSAQPSRDAAEPGRRKTDKRTSSVQAGPGKRDWHAVIRQRLKLRVRIGLI